MSQTRLVIADDHPLIIDGLVKLLSAEADLQVTAACSSGAEALKAVIEHRPDILILDLQLGDMTGWDLIEQIRDENLPTRIVILTGSLPEERIVDLIQSGVAGVVFKEAESTVLLKSIREVRAGGQWLDNKLVQQAIQQLSRRNVQNQRLTTLTAREREVIRLVATGHRNKEIARQLSITEGTVKIHIHNVYEKVGVTNRVELARFARQHRLE